jgi:hypothetical protein
MKGATMRGIMTLALVLFMMTLVYADFPDNPDRYTSITFIAGFDTGTGEHKITDFDFSIYKQDLKPSAYGASATLLAPMSNNASFIAKLSYSASETKAERNNSFSYDSDSKYGIFSISIGLKLYIK